MGQMVIVVSFPEPTNGMEMARYMQNVTAPFASRTDVKVHMARNEVADRIISIFDPLHEIENTDVTHSDPKRHNVFDNNEKD